MRVPTQEEYQDWDDEYDGAIFIDDPELGLDARTDSMLGRALETLLPCAQFIYATKSPGLWEHAYSFERAMLLQPGDLRGRREHRELTDEDPI